MHFGDQTTDYCNAAFATDPTNLQKCLSLPLGAFTPAPWTVVGKTLRGLPQTEPAAATAQAIASGLVATPAGTSPSGAAQPLFTPQTVSTITSVLLYGSLGLLGVALFMSFRKRKRKGRR